MTSPIPYDARPVHPLEYWLSPDLARVSPPNAPSRLRQLADAQGTLAAGWSSAIAGGPVLALAGAFYSATSGNPAAFAVLGPLGAALTALGLSFWKRVRATLPNTDKALITRGPGSARGGIVMVSVLAVILGGILSTFLPAAASRGDGTALVLAGTFLLIVALLVACILVPSVVLGRARQSFRQRVQVNPELRRAVEQDLAVWHDPYGTAGYGPL
ncbi:hypothetical protein M8J71_13435 [Pseudarthrobacter sp. R1]|uniref:hypothetical protein n=1 Tax=Pseudarthrobacter sp. R1 TaxID=2944934 RepID=UPI00210A44DC|nr:hypothetical protein [Pseudarthrobacter sp. R1]MCQ6271482.1 hypothetical protein [Pseudarthrobacter sp. R1]